MIGLMMNLEKLATSAVNAVPMTTAMASSMMLPRMRKSLKPLSTGASVGDERPKRRRVAGFSKFTFRRSSPGKSGHRSGESHSYRSRDRRGRDPVGHGARDGKDHQSFRRVGLRRGRNSEHHG